jgi:hypothetical protein
MQTFLEQVAHHVIEAHGSDLHRIAIVVPGQRAGAHLQKYLSQRIGRAFWAPRMMDMGQLLAHIADAQQAHRPELLLTLHRTVNLLQPNEPASLDELLQWGPTVLNDMSEVDHHLIDLDELYRDLRSYAEIEQWSLALDDELSESQLRSVAHWQRNGELHRSMHAQMNSTRRGTSGWIAREAAARAAVVALPWEAVWCVGANALEPATTAVLRALDRRGSLRTAWDTDRYFLDDPLQEAGRFIRRSMEALGPGLIPPSDLLRTKERSIRNITVPDARAQVQAAVNELVTLTSEERERTLVLLADETLVAPLLSCIPPTLEPVNISSGIPWQQWPLKGLLDLFIELHQEYQRSGQLSVGSLHGLLAHPLASPSEAAFSGVPELADHDRPFVKGTELRAIEARHAWTAGLIAPLRIPSPSEAARALLTHLSIARASDSWTAEQVARAMEGSATLCSELALEGLDIDRSFTLTSVRDHLLTIPALGSLGDPWEGIQVMGLLETRALAAERLLIVGANEGHLPKTSVQQSFIPFDIRRALGLPLRGDDGAVQAYHVHRLLQHTEQVTLISHSGGSIEPAQPSRFLAQWEYELVPVSRTTIEHTMFAAPAPTAVRRGISIARAPWINEALAGIARKGLSPTALSNWLRCPLDLFFRRVIGVQEPQDSSSRLDGRDLGSAVHEVLCQLVKPHLGTPLSAQDVQNWRPGLGQRIAQAIASATGNPTPNTGHHLLSLNMAQLAVDTYLQDEAARIARGAVVTPLAVELDLEHELPNGSRIFGRCDRIELRDGVVHILDLKTGSVRPDQVKLQSLDRDRLRHDQGYALQLLIYAWAYLLKEPDVISVRTGLIPLQRSSRSEGMWLTVEGSDLITRDVLPAITDMLTRLSNEIIIGDTPLRHDPLSAYCVCCLNEG